MKETIKISESEVRQMIKEEYSKKLTEIKLKNRLQQINEEMQSIMSEDNLDEVQAGGLEKSVSGGWSNPEKDSKYSEKFTKKGSHLIEDEKPEGEEVIVDEIPAADTEIGAEIGAEVGADAEPKEDDLDIEAILAQLADAIEDKIETTVDAKVDGGEVAGEEKPEISIDAEETPEEKPEEEMPMQEQDGTSVAQEVKPKDAVPFDNGKAEIPAADKVVSEGKALVSEATMKRMQILSGIRKNDFND